MIGDLRVGVSMLSHYIFEMRGVIFNWYFFVHFFFVWLLISMMHELKKLILFIIRMNKFSQNNNCFITNKTIQNHLFFIQYSNYFE